MVPEISKCILFIILIIVIAFYQNVNSELTVSKNTIVTMVKWKD